MAYPQCQENFKKWWRNLLRNIPEVVVYTVVVPITGSDKKSHLAAPEKVLNAHGRGRSMLEWAQVPIHGFTSHHFLGTRLMPKDSTPCQTKCMPWKMLQVPWTPQSWKGTWVSSHNMADFLLTSLPFSLHCTGCSGKTCIGCGQPDRKQPSRLPNSYLPQQKSLMVPEYKGPKIGQLWLVTIQLNVVRDLSWANRIISTTDSLSIQITARTQ